MKRIEKVTKTYESEEVLEHKCDLCGKDLMGSDPHFGSFDFATLQIEEGHSYPENGRREKTIVDICADCMRTKVLPWLAQQGVTPRTEETDW
jgi:hypothetical protein